MNPGHSEQRVGGYSDIHWRSLRYFNVYRVAVATILLASVTLNAPVLSVISGNRIELLQELIIVAYALCTVAALAVSWRYQQRFNMQLSINVSVDVLVMTLLVHLGGGLGSGLGSMLLVTLAGAGLVGQGRLVLFYAAMATIAVLFEQAFRSFVRDVDVAGFFQAGVFSAGFFAVAVSARLLARRVIANEELARRRGIDLRNQTLISQRAIEEMQDGVLVLSRQGWVRQHNPRAEQLLGLKEAPALSLANYSRELAESFEQWCRHETLDPVLIRVLANGTQLSARFVSTDSSEHDVLVFLEDIGRVQERAQQIKLAALGRLTASIAHEVRNPLSAINHAGELMREELADPGSARLLKIVLDNTRRVDRIVSDVLALGRRDRAHREAIDLREMLPRFLEEYVLKENVTGGLVTLRISGAAVLDFDRSHLHQVLWNLLGNALRHSQRLDGSVSLLVCDSSLAKHVEVHVIDDGSGVDKDKREQIFEPFFTTHSKGTGLGLFIARELCEANAAQLELMEGDGGADFRVLGRGSG